MAIPSIGRRRGIPGIAILVLGAAVMFFPVVWFIFSAFKTRSDIIAVPLQLWPRKWTVDGFSQVWTQTQLARAYANSLGLALLTLASVLFTSSLGGYTFARLRFPGRKVVFYFILSTTMVPFVTLLIPLFLVMKELHLVNTYIGVWLPSAASSFGIFLCRQYITTIPRDFYEAAKLDGASDWQIYLRIVLPLIKPVLAVIATFSMVLSFNDYLWPLVILDDQRKFTLPLELAQTSQTLGVASYETVIAGALLASIPGVAIFLAFQRHILKGAIIGGLKD